MDGSDLSLEMVNGYRDEFALFPVHPKREVGRGTCPNQALKATSVVAPLSALAMMSRIASPCAILEDIPES